MRLAAKLRRLWVRLTNPLVGLDPEVPRMAARLIKARGFGYSCCAMANAMGRTLLGLTWAQSRYIRAYEQFTRRRHGSLPVWWNGSICSWQAARMANLNAFADAIEQANRDATIGRETALKGTV